MLLQPMLLLLLHLQPVASLTTVLVYSQPGLNGGGLGDCGDEGANLASIVQNAIDTSPITVGGTAYDFSSFVVDTSLQSFGDPDLATKLAGASYFFMTDQEGSLTGFDASSQAG